MSKHYNNYTNYNKPQVMSEPTPDAENVPAPEVEEEIMAQPALTIEEIAEQEPEETVAPPVEPKTGIVTANKLNIRSLPSANASVAAVVDKNAQLMLDPEYETVEWYKVYTASGIEGYCMKKFVTVK